MNELEEKNLKLQQEIHQKDELIATIKNKTREFVQKIKDENELTITNLKEESNKLSLLNAEKDNKIDHLNQELQRVREIATRELKDSNASTIADYEGKINELQILHSAAKKELQENHESRIATYEAKITELTLSHSKEVETIRQQLLSSTSELEAFKNEIHTLQFTINDMTTQMVQQQSDYEGSQQQRMKLEEELHLLRQSYQEKSQENVELSHQNELYRDEKESLLLNPSREAIMKEIQDQTSQQLKDHEKTIDDQNQNILQLSQQVEDLRQQLTLTHTDIQTSSPPLPSDPTSVSLSETEKLDQLQKELLSVQTKNELLQQQLATIEMDRDQWKQKEIELKKGSNADRKKHSIEINRVKEGMERISLELNQTRQELEVRCEEIERLKKETSKHIQERDSLLKQLQVKDELLTGLQQELQRQSASIEKDQADLLELNNECDSGREKDAMEIKRLQEELQKLSIELSRTQNELKERSEEVVWMKKDTSHSEERDSLIRQLQAKDEMLNGLRQEFQQQLTSVEKDRDDWKQNEMESKKEIEKDAMEINRLQIELQRLSMELSQTRSEFEGKSEEIIRMKKDTSHSEEKDGLMRQLQAKDEMLSGLRKENLSLNESLKGLESQSKSQKEDLQQVLDQLTQQSEEMEKRTKENHEMEGRIRKLQEELQMIQKEKDNLSEAYVVWTEERMQIMNQLEMKGMEMKKLQQDGLESMKKVEEEGQKRNGERMGELIATRADLQAKSEILLNLQRDMEALQDKYRSIEKEKVVLEGTNQSLLTTIEELKDNALKNEEKLLEFEKKFEEKEKSVKLQWNQQQLQSQKRIQELIGEKEECQKEWMQCRGEYENLLKNHTILEKKFEDLTVKLKETTHQLDGEIQQNQDRKKKVRTYLDTLAAENKSLSEKIMTMEMNLKDITAAKLHGDERLLQYETQLKINYDQYQQELEKKNKEWMELDDSYRMQLMEKEKEIQHLELQVQLTSQTNVEEVMETRQKIQESLKELESHKAKRLAARNEMIQLAKSLEKAQLDGEEIKNTLQVTLTPMVYEQVHCIEGLVKNIELISYHLTSRRPQTYQSLQEQLDVVKSRTFSSDQSNLQSGSPDSSSEFMVHGGKTKSLKSSSGLGGAGGNGGVNNSLNAISDALNQVDTLRIELDRVQMGLTLIQLSVNKLMDIVSVQPSCCTSILDLFSVPTVPMPSSSSSTSYSSRPFSNGNSANSTTTMINTLHYPTREQKMSTAKINEKNMKSKNYLKILDPITKSKSSNGYKNINNSTSHSGHGGETGFFSIETYDDDETEDDR